MISLEKLKEFREHILDLAIRGKLVEQRPEEGTAEDLYQQIREEKAKLIKEGKLKKEKPLQPIAESKVPFSLPKSWKWISLGNVISIKSGEFLPADKMKNGKFPVYGGNGVSGYHNEALVHKRTIVIGRVGAKCGNVCLTESEAWVTDNAFITSFPELFIDKKFLLFLLKSLNLGKFSSSTAQPVISGKTIYPLPCPLPPLAEQKRIVAKVESYLSVIEKAEDLLKRKVDLDGQIKEKILQMAIQGKLVEQRPEEGTAEDLYQQIQAEKQKLIEEGKLKKEKPLAPIEDDEIPFDIPDSWRWVRIGDLYKHNTGKALNSSNIEGKKLPYITTSNLYWNRFELNNLKKMFFKDSEIEKCSVQNGDLLVCEGGDIGRAAIWNFDYQVCIQNHIHKLRGYIQLSTLFYYYIFLYYKLNNSISGRGIGIQGLSSNALHNLVVPLPPLAEQKRIVAKVEELLALCDKLKLK